MHYTVSAKNCQVSPKWLKRIDNRSKKLVRRIPFLDDSVHLNFTINRHKNLLYEGDVLLRLPQKSLYTTFKGQETPEKLIEKMFSRLYRKLDWYKGMHIAGHSKYSSTESIRKQPEDFFVPQVWSVIPDAKRKRRSKYETQRQILVEEFLKLEVVRDKRVLAALQYVPRHLFVSQKFRDEAYLDICLPNRFGQVISQPSLVGSMTQALDLKGDENVLEIGTGSGYMSGVLSRLAGRVYSIELLPSLAKHARTTLKKLGYENVFVIVGNGLAGLSEHAPFDAIVSDAAVPTVPKSWFRQLKEGGRIVIPVGKDMWHQELICGTKKNGRLLIHKLKKVSLTPLIEKTKIPLAEISNV